MAEHATPPRSDDPSTATRRRAARAEADRATASRAERLGGEARSQAYDSLADRGDRYAFYFFMGTLGLGTLLMIVFGLWL
jgi:hypothetical protein